MNIMHYNTNTTQKYSIERVNTMKTFKKIALFAICLTLVLTCVCACAEKPATEDTKLVMATNANFPPYEFKGDNEGLIVAEVELSSADEAVVLPPWIGDEVTGERCFYNSFLIKHPFKSWTK